MWEHLHGTQSSIQIEIEGDPAELLQKLVDQEELARLLVEQDIEDSGIEDISIFISHSYQDSEYASEFAKKFSGLTYEVTTAGDVSPGDDLIDVIGSRIQESDVMIVLLTEEGITSPGVQVELGIALEKFRRDPDYLVIPVLAGEEAYDTSLPLKELKYVDATKSMDWAIEKIDMIIKAHFN